jgi:hypothetical protein
VDVTLAIATFGAESWIRTANRHALASARTFGAPVAHAHADTLHAARNACLDEADTDWIVYIDADDALHPGYLRAMATGRADVRVPAVAYITPDDPDPDPIMPRVAWPAGQHEHACTGACLPWGNWIVIGAAARTQLLRDIGGWRPFALEDWDLWLRCHLAGATIEAVPDAVYRATGRLTGRGLGGDPDAALAAHREVARANRVPVP